METLLSILQAKASKAIEEAFSLHEEAEITLCIQEEFGHYQCNSALKLAKTLKKKPIEIAKALAEKLNDPSVFAKVEVAGAGFVNLFLAPAFLSKELKCVLADYHLGIKREEKPKKIVVDFSSPNVAKELHVGHLRSTIIGDTIARLFETLGDVVLRLNHIGDWGTQFGMLIAYLKEYEPSVLAGKKSSDLTQLTFWYKEAKQLFDSDETFRHDAYKEVINLQTQEKSAVAAWTKICDISREAFTEIYKLLDVKILERGESFYQSFIPEMLQELEKKGLLQISDGAKCVFIEGFLNREGHPLPLIIQKSDGGYNYDTTDLCGFYHRCLVEKADRIIIVTDAGQSMHFNMVYAAAVKAGFLDPKKTRFDHVPFGFVLNTEGKKFRTRSGETEKLIDLLKEAIHYAKKITYERLPTIEHNELDKIAEVLGIDAIKYADLSCHRVRDYTFSYERMMHLEGNTAAFLLYAYVRILGIERKVNANMDEVIKKYSIQLDHPSEIALGLQLRRFGEVLEAFSLDLLPNRLAEYLYELACKFNGFFRDCRVEGSPCQNPRLVLCELTARILKKGLYILGLKTVDRM